MLVTSVCTGCYAAFSILLENHQLPHEDSLTNHLKYRACCIHPFTMLHYINCFGITNRGKARATTQTKTNKQTKTPETQASQVKLGLDSNLQSL